MVGACRPVWRSRTLADLGDMSLVWKWLAGKKAQWTTDPLSPQNHAEDCLPGRYHPRPMGN
jgi:hypothetical protein